MKKTLFLQGNIVHAFCFRFLSFPIIKAESADQAVFERQTSKWAALRPVSMHSINLVIANTQTFRL